MFRLFFTPGSRTYILSALALVMILLLQLDYQDSLALAPFVTTSLKLALTIIVPLVPVYIRKAITNMQADLKKDINANPRVRARG